jgi:hypothetical membrane protein
MALIILFSVILWTYSTMPKYSPSLEEIVVILIMSIYAIVFDNNFIKALTSRKTQ